MSVRPIPAWESSAWRRATRVANVGLADDGDTDPSFRVSRGCASLYGQHERAFRIAYDIGGKEASIRLLQTALIR